MLFSSISFIYYFLPVALLVYYCTPHRHKNAVLLGSSLLFYFLGEPRYTFILIVSVLVDYTHSLMIEKYRGTAKAKVALVSSIVINLGMLGFFKYADFFIATVNDLWGADLNLLHMALPIGISFFTFQTMSYTIDVYRGHVPAEKSILRLATYVTLFPQLIAGPIVRYRTVAEELLNRTHSFENFASGINRFVLGLGKKVLIANQLGELSGIAMASESPTTLLLWMGTMAFALQIYFDFSGYSDMAIGLGRMFGFHFLENFTYPFISKSITEFWSRWHISLGTWFKDYVYIPLGGNRTTALHWYKNILIVWFLTGIWHGASWNFVLWGLYFAFVLVLEKLFLKPVLEALPRLLRHLYVIVVVNISFVIFNHTQFSEISKTLKGLFGLSGLPFYSQETHYYLTSYAVILCLSLIGATPLLSSLYSKVQKRQLWQRLTIPLESMAISILFLVVTAYLVDASFNPFLYFRF